MIFKFKNKFLQILVLFFIGVSFSKVSAAPPSSIEEYTTDSERFYVSIEAPCKSDAESSIRHFNDTVDFINMEHISVGLEDGLDVSLYANPEFTWEQIKYVISDY